MAQNTSVTLPPLDNPSPTPDGANTSTEANKGLSDSNAIRIYRIGIGEVAFIPLQPVISETIKMQNEIDNSLYAKTNPLVSYTNTIRSYKFDAIVSFDIANFTFDTDNTSLKSTYGTELMDLYTLLRSFLYANYETVQYSSTSAMVARTIKSPPLFKVKFKNLLSYSEDGLCPPGSAKQVGLLGTFSDFKIEPLFVGNYVPWSSDMSVINRADSQQTETKLNGNNAGYQKLQMSFTFVPISQQPMGWESGLGTDGTKFGGISELRQSIAKDNAIKKILGS